MEEKRGFGGMEPGTTAALMAAANPLLPGNALLGAAGATAAPQLAAKTIHVGNLSPAVSVEVLRQIFGCIGQIVDVRVASDGRYGFVDFAEAEAATAALNMNGTDVCGHQIRVQRATQPRLYSNQANPPPAPMLAQLQPVPEFSAIAGVTSAAALEALQKQAKHAAPTAAVPGVENMPNFAFMNPAQQRAALEARHREMLASSGNVSGWGVAKRREESASDDSPSDSDDSRYRRRRDRRRRRDKPRRSRRDRYHYDRRDYRRRRDDDDDDDDDARRRLRQRGLLRQLSSRCFANAAGFLRFSSSLMEDDEEEFPRNPLDETRIHPECYFDNGEAKMQDWAQKMCTDALDRELRRSDYRDVVAAAMGNSRAKLASAIRNAEAPHDRQRYAAFGGGASAQQPLHEGFLPPRFGELAWTATEDVGVADDRSRKDHPDAVADDRIGDKLNELDLDQYAAILEETYHMGKRREQLEDIKRELRWPFAELRARAWEVPDETTVFEWFAGAAVNSPLEVRQVVLRGRVCPAGAFAPRLRPRQILTVRVQGADAHRLYVELAGEVAGGLRGALDKAKLVEAPEMRPAIGVDDDLVHDVAEHRASPRVANRDAARLDDGDVFEACVETIDTTRLRVNLSRLDVDVFFPATLDDYFAHDATKDEPLLDPKFDRDRAAADYVALAAARRKLALEARALRLDASKKNRLKDAALGPRNLGAARLRRNIQHPAYKRDANTFVKAEAVLADETEGLAALIRPSASSHKLVLSWVFRPGVYKHVEIDDLLDLDDDDDDGKPRYDTRGVLIRRKSAKPGGFKIGDKVYEDIDEIMANHVDPMNAYVADVVAHRKFVDDVSDVAKANDYLAQQRVALPNAPHYCFWIDPTHAGYAVLSWLHPKASSARHDYVEITPAGVKLRDRLFQTLEACVDYFKRHAKDWYSSRRSQSASTRRSAPSASVDTRPSVDSRLAPTANPTPRRHASAANPTPRRHASAANPTPRRQPAPGPPPPAQVLRPPPADPPAFYSATTPHHYSATTPHHWQTDQQPSYYPPDPSAPPQRHAPPPPTGPATGPPGSAWPPQPEAPGGRGRGRTLPAWMQAADQNPRHGP